MSCLTGLAVLVLAICFLASCNPRQEAPAFTGQARYTDTSDQAQNAADTLSPLSNSPFPLDTMVLDAFQKFSSNTIRKALNDPDLQYEVRQDTLATPAPHSMDHYFLGPGLQHIRHHDFILPAPNSRFSFDLIGYTYASVSEAYAMLGKAATIEHAADFGLAKQPSFIFRIDNHVVWFTAPHAMSGSTFSAFKNQLVQQLREHTLDTLESHVQYAKRTTFETQMHGKWRITLPIAIDAADTSYKFPLDNVVIEIRDSILRINRAEYTPDKIYEKRLPDAQAYLSYYGMSPPEGRQLPPVFQTIRGAVTEYRIYFENLSGREMYRPGSPFKPSHVQAFVKLPSGQFGFILDDALYLLEGVGGIPRGTIKRDN